MSNPHEKDHWRELAELLGLPPDESRAAPTLPPPAAHHEAELEERKPEPPAPDWDRPEARPAVADSFEPAAYEEVNVSEHRLPLDEPGEPAPSEWAPPDLGPAELTAPNRGAGEESPQDRPRRGRRRGRRGQKEDAPDRDHRTRHERAPRAEDSRQPPVEPIGDSKSQADPEEAREENRGARDRGRAPAEARRRDVEEDDVLEMEDVEQAEPVQEEDDDEEIDKLTDWNVPSWTELIGSLYRPER